MASETFDDLKPLLVFLGDNTYSFPEFIKVRSWDNDKYCAMVFKLNIYRDRVSYYTDCWGKRVSFGDFFEKCNEQTQEQILFNLDFFRPVL